VRRLLAGLILATAALPAVHPAAAGVAAAAGPPPSGYAAVADGTALSVTTRQGPPAQGLASIAVGASRAAVGSTGLVKAAGIGDGPGPASQTPRTYGRGAGIELGLGQGTALATSLSLSGVAEAGAPPAGRLVTKEVGPFAAGPLVYASLLRAQAEPAWSDRSCVVGRPLGFGQGSVADAQVLALGDRSAGPFQQALLALDAGRLPGRVISQSTSLTYLAPNGAGAFALVSEVRQTIAPVTLFKGLPGEITIEFLGEFVLRATAGGRPGSAKIDYGPAGDPTPTTPVVRILTGGHSTELTTQQVFGHNGLAVLANPLVELRLGEAPRPSSDALPAVAADGTSAAAVADVVSVRLLGPVPGLEGSTVDVRLGHMESHVRLPAGGVPCPLPVRKKATATMVDAGQPFGFEITVPSSVEALDGLSCDLVGLRAVDTVAGTDGLRFTLTSASAGGSVSGDVVRWNALGHYHAGDPPTKLTVAGHVEPGSRSGVLRDTVVVTADLDRCTGGSTHQPLAGFRTTTGPALIGTSTLVGPRISGGEDADRSW
jgi:hypothetical protein